MILGKSGKGKSYLALRLAYALSKHEWSKVYASDTEQGSLDLADGVQLYDGCTCEGINISDINPAEVQASTFLADRDEAKKLGGVVHIIDSTTHAWNNLLNVVNKLDADNAKLNKFNAWGQPEVMYEKNVLGNNLWRDEAIHCITTVRLKDKVIMNPDTKEVSKMFDAPVMQEQAVYEPDLVLQMVQAGTATTNPIAKVIKSRYAPFIEGQTIEFSAEMCEVIVQYLDEGATPEDMTAKVAQQYIDSIAQLIKDSKAKQIKLKGLYKSMNIEDGTKLTALDVEQLSNIYNSLK